MSEQRYIEAINANPDDRLPQYVYADWLDEMGDPRGEAWRVLIEAGKRPYVPGVCWRWVKTYTPAKGQFTPEHAMLDFNLPHWIFVTFHAAMNAAAIAWVRCHVDAEFEPDLLHRS